MGSIDQRVVTLEQSAQKVEERLEVVEKQAMNLHDGLKEVSKETLVIKTTLDQFALHMKDQVASEINGIREQSNAHYTSMAEKMDKVIENTQVLSLINEKPSDFIAKWNYLCLIFSRSIRTDETIRRTLWGLLIGAIAGAAVVGFKVYLGVS